MSEIYHPVCDWWSIVNLPREYGKFLSVLNPLGIFNKPEICKADFSVHAQKPLKVTSFASSMPPICD